MRHLRILGLMLLAAMAFGSYAAAMASAEEPGILPLLGAKSTTVELHLEEAKEPKLKTGAGEIKCGKLDLTVAKATGSHITLFNEVDLMFLECELIKGESKLKCRSEDSKGAKDNEGVILVLADFHFVDLLNGASLVPGVEVIILDVNTKAVGIVKIKCGIGNIEVKGVVKGLVLVASLTTDVKEFKVDFPTALPCDTNDTLCKSLESPFESNIGGKFEAATQEVTVPVKSNAELLFDD
jgi:hypothetical protein